MPKTKNGFVRTNKKITLYLDIGILEVLFDLSKKLKVSQSFIVQQALIDKFEEVKRYEDE